ncbi:hypothetical protein [Bacillus suaedaesalsae]|uniref:Uncharacterized protein n=1 Tax=Bacillus suaedaesalsae TaxID=2810349 RepID=A0ABS2DKP3_9BACI|nr:hypothetical protein [Bacillus suaedaesalsae]MBM6618976.1 hypothetical protein [Bacillus suaedaesalsae]
MRIINDFVWKENEKSFTWTFEGENKEKLFKNVPRSVVELSDKSGFAIVGSYDEFGKKNAFILNADGTERLIFTIPNKIRDAICFHEIYYIMGELTAIIVAGGIDFACIINSDTGEFKEIYETR